MTIYDQLPALPVAVLLFSAPIAYLLRARGLPWAAATAATVTAFIMSCLIAATVFGGESIVYEMGGWPAPYGIVLHIDALSAAVRHAITRS